MRTWVTGGCQQTTRCPADKCSLHFVNDYVQVASVKYKKESLACPQIKLFNSSTFAGENIYFQTNIVKPKVNFCVN